MPVTGMCVCRGAGCGWMEEAGSGSGGHGGRRGGTHGSAPNRGAYQVSRSCSVVGCRSTTGVANRISSVVLPCGSGMLWHISGDPSRRALISSGTRRWVGAFNSPATASARHAPSSSAAAAESMRPESSRRSGAKWNRRMIDRWMHERMERNGTERDQYAYTMCFAFQRMA
jgi:hypothetical protein